MPYNYYFNNKGTLRTKLQRCAYVIGMIIGWITIPVVFSIILTGIFN